MFKLLLSAIALSLFSASLTHAQSGEALLAKRLLEQELSPAKEDWKLKADAIPKDLMGMKGQSVSLIDWSEDPDEATDIDRWLIKTHLQAKSPDWLVRLRNARQMELVGKILSCSGSCEIVRGLSAVKGQYLSQLLEGDELTLSENSSAWVYLIDGSLLRLAAKTTVTFGEVNFSKDEVFLYLKLLEGHVHYEPRYKAPMPEDLGPETDADSLPLMVEVANEAHFEREIFKEQNSFGHLGEYLLYEKHAKHHQFKFLNDLKSKNNLSASVKSSLMIVAPNMTIVGQEVSFDMMYLLGSKGYVKKKSLGHLDLYLRGYSRTESYVINEDRWVEVIENGRGFEFAETSNKGLEILELITKRIVSLKIAQEIWYKEFTLPIIKNLDSSKNLAENAGYFLWDQRLQERKHFLEEYTRRLQTTHLQSLSNLITKMEKRGEELAKTPTNVYYQKALDSYLWSLKNKYNLSQMQIREANNLQYYVWLLKNVKSKKQL